MEKNFIFAKQLLVRDGMEKHKGAFGIGKNQFLMDNQSSLGFANLF